VLFALMGAACTRLPAQLYGQFQRHWLKANVQGLLKRLAS
jgi:hypothetical protein